MAACKDELVALTTASPLLLVIDLYIRRHGAKFLLFQAVTLTILTFLHVYIAFLEVEKTHTKKINTSSTPS